MPLVIYGAAHTGKRISVIFQKNSIRHMVTQLPEIFLKNFLISKNSFWDFINLQNFFFPVAKFS